MDPVRRRDPPLPGRDAGDGRAARGAGGDRPAHRSGGARPRARARRGMRNVTMIPRGGCRVRRRRTATGLSARLWSPSVRPVASARTLAAEPAGHRERLIAAMAASIEEKGYRDTTVADVVRIARTSRRNFYEHFDDRDACFLALFDATNDAMMREIAAAVHPDRAARRAGRQRRRRLHRQRRRPARRCTAASSASCPGSARRAPTAGWRRSSASPRCWSAWSTPAARRSPELVARPLTMDTAIIIVGGLRELLVIALQRGPRHARAAGQRGRDDQGDPQRRAAVTALPRFAHVGDPWYAGVPDRYGDVPTALAYHDASDEEPACPRPTTRDVEIAIAGAGLSGLGMAIALRRDGIEDFVVLERADDLGGTWRDNSYPGCACDIPSVLYSYTDEPNPAWTPRLRRPARDPGLHAGRRPTATTSLGHMRYDHEVLAADWDDERQRWSIGPPAATSPPRSLISAVGALADPSIPDLPGLGHVPGHRLSLRALGSRPRSHRPPRGGGRHRRLGDPVRPRDPAAGRPPRPVPAHAAVGAAARQPGDPERWRRRFARHPRLHGLAARGRVLGAGGASTSASGTPR